MIPDTQRMVHCVMNRNDTKLHLLEISKFGKWKIYSRQHNGKLVERSVCEPNDMVRDR